MRREILFFDDFPLQSDSKLFIERLRSRLRAKDINIRVEKTIAAVEGLMRTEALTLAILDIMSAVPPDFRDASGLRVHSTLAGIEILRRCRGGEYLPRNSDMPILMRTSRGEGYIRRECLQAGATGFFIAGKEDGRLIARVHVILAAARG